MSRLELGRVEKGSSTLTVINNTSDSSFRIKVESPWSDRSPFVGATIANWRCVLPPNKEGLMGLAVDGDGGQVYRFLLPESDMRHIAGTTLEYLDSTLESECKCSCREVNL